MTLISHLIVGLGNYHLHGTKHNMGMICLDQLHKQMGLMDWKFDSKIGGYMSELCIADQNIILFKPKTLMNISGNPVCKALQKYSLKPPQLLIVHDDLERNLGKVSIKLKGSANGHNGIKS